MPAVGLVQWPGGRTSGSVALSMTTLPRPAPLTLRALRLMAAVHAQGSLTAAAEALHLSVSTLSRAVQALEASLQITLLQRGARGVVPTPAAQALVRCHARVQPLLLDLVSLSVSGPPSTRANAPESHVRRLTETMLASLSAVADTGSETQAALRLGISQPAVHQHLRALEGLVGSALLRRAASGMRFTETGERALRLAKLVLNELRLAEDDLAHLSGWGDRGVVVGVLPMASTGWLPAAMAQVWGDDAALRITVIDGTYDALLERLRCGDVDVLVGPLRGRNAVPDVSEVALIAEPLVVVVGQGHPLVRVSRGLKLADLLDHAWVAPLPATPARAGFDQLFADAGVPPPRPVAEANSPSVLRALLAQGRHLALVSPLQVDGELRSGELVRLAPDVVSAMRTVGVTVRRHGRLPTGGERLLAALWATAESRMLIS